MDWLLGTVKEEAAREYVNYDAETGTRRKDFGDRIGDLLTGRGAAIDKAVQDQHVAGLKRTYGSDLTALEALPNYNPLTIDKNTDPEVLKREIDRRRGALIALEEVRGSNPDFKIDSLGDNPTAGAIRGAGAIATRNESDRRIKEAKDERKGESRRIERRQDHKEKMQIERLDRKDAQARLDRLSDRRATADTNRMNMQLEYARMAQNDRYRQQDKKDKAMMMLLQGLGNLGAAFTI